MMRRGHQYPLFRRLSIVFVPRALRCRYGEAREQLSKENGDHFARFVLVHAPLSESTLAGFMTESGLTGENLELWVVEALVLWQGTVQGAWGEVE